MRLVSSIDSALDRVVPASLGHDADVLRQAKRVAAFDVAMLFWALLFAAIYAAFGSVLCALVTLWVTLPILTSLAAISRGRSPAFCGNLLCAGGFTALTALGLASGGWNFVPPMLWYTVLPVVALLTSGVLWGVVWTLIPLAAIATFAALAALDVPLPHEMAQPRGYAFGFAVAAGLVLCQFILAWVRVGVEQRALDALREAQRSLAKTRAEIEALKEGFDFSMDDWARVQREKAALEYFVRQRFGTLSAAADLDELELDDADWDDADWDDDEAQLDDLRMADC